MAWKNEEDKKEYYIKYFQENKEKISKQRREPHRVAKKKIYQKKYREKNREKIKKQREESEYDKQYYQKNKETRNAKAREYNKQNKEKIKEYAKVYGLKNKDRIKKQAKIYRDNHKEKCYDREKNTIYRKKYLKENPYARIPGRLRTLLGHALRKYTNAGKYKSSKKYGVDYKKIIEHLKPFPEDISKYHIDHIKPLCSFDLTKQEEVEKAFAPENHQWLLAHDNLVKSGKL